MKEFELNQIVEMPDELSPTFFFEEYLTLVERYNSTTGGTFEKYVKLTKLQLIKLRIKELVCAIKWGV